MKSYNSISMTKQWYRWKNDLRKLSRIFVILHPGYSCVRITRIVYVGINSVFGNQFVDVQTNLSLLFIAIIQLEVTRTLQITRKTQYNNNNKKRENEAKILFKLSYNTKCLKQWYSVISKNSWHTFNATNFICLNDFCIYFLIDTFVRVTNYCVK